MKKGVNYLFSIHRITGCIIAGFFLMWFVTGLILIYHPYPRLTDEQLYEKKEILPSLLPDIQSIKQKAGENINNCISGSLKDKRWQPLQQQTVVLHIAVMIQQWQSNR